MHSIHTLLALFLLGVATPLFGQFGVGVTYTQPQSRFDRSTESYIDNGMEYSLNYWFRLKEKRVEFLPTLSYSRYDIQGTSQSNSLPSNITGELSEVGFQFHTRIYPFDFGTDCDCPTFGKQGPALEKGFFIQLSPGVSRIEEKAGLSDSVIDVALETDSSFFPTVGAALGLDFGINNLITLSPIAGIRWGLGDLPASTLLFLDDNSVNEGTDYWKWFAGIHLGIRLDKRRY